MANTHIIIGLGATGLSCARFLSQQGKPFIVMDTRKAPPNLEKFRQEFPQVIAYTGSDWPQSILNEAQQLIVSPGVPLAVPAIQEAKAHGVSIIGDIELFSQHNKVPVIAITGANGKSTVVTLMGEMVRACGKKVAVIGNIGEPVLNMIAHENPDFVVMELSSFQLETTYSLKPLAATVLNITPDHMDRYANLDEYVRAKHRIYQQTQNAIINKQDPLSDSDIVPPFAKRWQFTLDEPCQNELGLRQKDGQRWLAYGENYLLPAKDLKIVGDHNIANALSALALGFAAGLDQQAMIQAIRTFSGLKHRCEWVAEKKGIYWINDSKATNIGATIAALKGIASNLKGKIVLLLGGDGKGADFNELAPVVATYCRVIIVMGKDAKTICDALGQIVSSFEVENMQQAVDVADKYAISGDVVLLSPACSSLDQYQDFNHRGQVFMDTVRSHLGS